jgi:hypothetical protein
LGKFQTKKCRDNVLDLMEGMAGTVTTGKMNCDSKFK